MAITAADILFKFSTTAGTAGNQGAGTAAGSLGKYISTTQITDATLHNLFDVITGDENAASEAEYRCLFVHNAHATLTWTAVTVWISAEVAGGAVAAISLDTTGVTVLASAPVQAKTIADENTAPATQTFTAPTTKGTGLLIGDIAAGSVAAIWVRRTAANSAALDSDGVTVRCEGDTAA